MGYRRDWSGSTATLASTNSSRKAEAGSQFAIVGGSTRAISFSDRYRILTGTQNAAYLGGISRHESFYGGSRKTLNPREYAQERSRQRPLQLVQTRPFEPQSYLRWTSTPPEIVCLIV